MPDPEHDQTTNPRVVCPECGSDVCTLQNTKRNWTHPSRIISGIVWLAVVIVVIGYWISLGNWGYSTEQVDLRRYIGSEYRLALIPWTPLADPDSGYLSSEQMERAVEGNAEALNRVRTTLQFAVDYADTGQGVSGLLGIQFGLKEPDAYITTDTQYRMGGIWFTNTMSETLQDVRDAGSMDPDRYFDWEVVEWSLFPTLSHSKESSDTTTSSTRSHSFTLHYLTILGVLCLCVLVVLSIRWVGSRVGVPILKKRLIRYALVAVLFLSCGIGAMLNPKLYNYRSLIANEPNPLSLLYSIEDLREMTQDPDRAAEWCADMLALIKADQHEDLLLGQLWVFDETIDKATHEMGLETFFVGAGYRFDLFVWVRGNYVQEASDVELPKSTRWDWPRNLRDSGLLRYRWGPPHAPSFIRVEIVHLALLAVTLYWMWAFFLWAGRVILGRVQRRRARRDQCTFCGYPLTPEGRNARSSPKPT